MSPLGCRTASVGALLLCRLVTTSPPLPNVGSRLPALPAAKVDGAAPSRPNDARPMSPATAVRRTKTLLNIRAPPFLLGPCLPGMKQQWVCDVVPAGDRGPCHAGE